MKKFAIIGGVVVACTAIAFYAGVLSRPPAQAAGGQTADGAQAARGGGAGRAGLGGGRGGRGAAGPMTVDVTTATRASVAQQLVVVGNLIGDATVSVVPRAAGRLQEISVRLGDTVRRGQRIAKIEDFELQQQVKQQDAAMEVSQATIRQREADLRLAETNAERSRNLFARQLLPKQTLDDTEARYQAAQAQLDLARAQNTQSAARLEELRINLDNTVIVSPVNGFVANRTADPGAFVGQNAPIVEVVDIGRVRLVANIVEKDLKLIQTGDGTRVGVDAYPGEIFSGRIARVSPVLDPATRTAPIEIEIPNPGFRLKPGMYARVAITTAEQKDALVVPSNAVVDYAGRRGVFMTVDSETVAFRAVVVGIEEGERVEILDGLIEGDRIVTTGAAGLRDGDRVLLAGPSATPRGQGGRGVTDAQSEDGPTPTAADQQSVGPGREGRRGFGARAGQGGAGGRRPGTTP